MHYTRIEGFASVPLTRWLPEFCRLTHLHLLFTAPTFWRESDGHAFDMDLDKLDDTEWDIVISGTGLPQSLFAL